MTTLKIVDYLPARHRAWCAVYDPCPDRCDCGAPRIPLVTLANAERAIAEAVKQALEKKP